MPFEIEQATDTYAIPIIAAYPDYGPILEPAKFALLWPKALANRINGKTARVIHIPFKKAPLTDAIGQFNHNKLPSSALSYYSREAYQRWGLLS